MISITRLTAITSVICIVLAGCSFEPNGLSNLEKAAKMYNEYKKSFPDVPDVTAVELVEMMEKKKNMIVLIDVREKREQAVSMIPGAITKEEFVRNLEKCREKIVVTYCTIGLRSGLYAKDLRKMGIDARNLKRSIIGWAEAGMDFIDKDGKPTRRVHVYGAKWNLIPEGYEGIY